MIWAKICAVQFLYFITNRLKSAANLSVAAFAHRDAPKSTPIIEPFEAKFASAVWQIDAKIPDHLLMEWFERAIEQNLVNFRLYKLRMRHLVGEIAIVRE